MIYADYEFRELRTEAELLEHFRLRFDVFSRLPHYKTIFERNSTGFDADAFDVCSRHFGLFKKGFFGEKMIGGLRVIDPNGGDFRAEQLRKMGLESLISRPISLNVYVLFPDASRHLVENGISPDQKTVEPSRFFLLKKHRSLGLALFILQSVGTFVYASGAAAAMIDCQRSLVPMYQKVGFRIIAHEPSMHGQPIDTLMLVDRKSAEASIPFLTQKVADWQREGSLKTRLAQYSRADLAFLYRGWRRRFFSKKARAATA